MSEEFSVEELADSFAEVLSAEWPRERAIAFAKEGKTFSQELWDEVAGLGWMALTVPEDHGGLGLDARSTAALHLALGAAAAPLPVIGTTLLASILSQCDHETARSQLLPQLAAGELRVAVSGMDAAYLQEENGSLSGTIPDLLDAPAADCLVLRAQAKGKTGWLVVSTDHSGISIEPTNLADTTRSLGTVGISNLAYDLVTFLPTSGDVDKEVQRQQAIAIAADSLGAGTAVLSGTIEYMMVREQFGKPIASFQALKHRVADHQTALVASKALLDDAAQRQPGTHGALLAALSAKQHISRVAAETARDCIQLHGGVGFTAEFFPHVYLKRTKLNEALFGTRAQILEKVADMLEAA